jgi:hypothetical protein
MTESDTPATEDLILPIAVHDLPEYTYQGETTQLDQPGEVPAADRQIHDKAAAYDAFLDALGDDMDRRLAEIRATLDRLAA